MTLGRDFDRSILLDKIEDSTLRVGVLGLGYVGLPLALTFAERASLTVTGFDLDEQRVTQLNQGRSYQLRLDACRIQRAIATKRFSATTDVARIAEQDVVIIAVATPLNEQGEPDLGDVERAAQTIARYLRRGMLVVLSSTTYPGTTEEVVQPILESSGLKSGADFLLAYCPEREDPGNTHFDTVSTTKIVGGVGETATRVAVAVFAKAVERVVPVASVRVAEAAKLTENVFRAVNIALVNELKVAYEKMGLDIWDVLDAAATKPFGFMRFNPGPGLGGHCIPIDPVYLSWTARQKGTATRLIDLASEINEEMPQYVLAKLLTVLRHRDRALENCQILVLGLAYKRDIDDVRESPAITLIEQLL